MKNSKEKILAAALKEFAAHGFGGARIDRIAKTAGINKAMIFYYFSSKQNLYRTVIKEALMELIPQVQQGMMRSETPDQFFKILPEVYIRFFAKKSYFLKMIGFEMIQNPDHITTLVAEFFSDKPVSPPIFIRKKISEWNQKGLISEPDPIHFFLNIIPLCLFSFLGKPMIEALFDQKIPTNEAYLQKRIHSITNLLKRGMLK